MCDKGTIMSRIVNAAALAGYLFPTSSSFVPTVQPRTCWEILASLVLVYACPAIEIFYGQPPRHVRALDHKGMFSLPQPCINL